MRMPPNSCGCAIAVGVIGRGSQRHELAKLAGDGARERVAVKPQRRQSGEVAKLCRDGTFE